MAKCLPNIRKAMPKVPVIGVFATSDPRIDQVSRIRCKNIAKMAADCISGEVILLDKTLFPLFILLCLLMAKHRPTL